MINSYTNSAIRLKDFFAVSRDSAAFSPVMTNSMLSFWPFFILLSSSMPLCEHALERMLIPFGLHHILYSPFYYDNAVVPGGLYAYWATKLPELAASTTPLKSLVPQAGFTATGFSKIFGCPGVALAFYATAKPEKKKKVMALLIPMTLTAIFCGVTEPIEFTFLFIAPPLFVVHALLAATLSTVMYIAGIVGIHSGGVIEMASLNWIPLAANHWQQYLIMLAIGLVFTAIWFIVFRFLIVKFDFKTPGREVETEEVKFYSKKEYRERQAGGSDAGSGGDSKSGGSGASLAELVLEGLGGKDNIVDLTNCATRLRVNVKDISIVQPDTYFKSIGAHGAMVKGKSVQVIIGLSVPKVRAAVEDLL
jgi:PTS system arbutin-like IIC component